MNQGEFRLLPLSVTAISKLEKQTHQNFFTLQIPSNWVTSNASSDSMQNVDAQSLNNLLQGLQAKVNDLQRSISEGAPTVQRHDDVIASVICPHLQARPMGADVRKRLLGRYPKSSALPKPNRDENGLASKALGEDKERKWVLTSIPQYQKELLDVARIASTGWQQARSLPNSEGRAEFLESVLRDVLVITLDNCQKLAESQLKHVFKAAGAEGAFTFINGANGESINTDDHNIIQQAHVEAMSEYKIFAKELRPAGFTGNRGGKGRGGRGGGRGGGGYSSGWHGSRGSGYGGKGKGRSSSWSSWGNGGKGGKGHQNNSAPSADQS